MTVRLPAATKNKLARLAGHTNRSISYLAGEAIADYAERELAIVEGIERGLEEAKTGRVVSHDAMRRLRDVIDRAPKE